MHFIICDQIDEFWNDEIGIGLIVNELENEPVLAPAYRDAAMLIDPVDGDLIAIAIIPAALGKAPGQLQDGTDGDGIWF